MRPDVGSTSPMIMAIVVVLPAPLPPSKTGDAAPFDPERRIVDGAGGLVELRRMRNVDRGLIGRGRLGRRCLTVVHLGDPWLRTAAVSVKALRPLGGGGLRGKTPLKLRGQPCSPSLHTLPLRKFVIAPAQAKLPISADVLSSDFGHPRRWPLDTIRG